MSQFQQKATRVAFSPKSDAPGRLAFGFFRSGVDAVAGLARARNEPQRRRSGTSAVFGISAACPAPRSRSRQPGEPDDECDNECDQQPNQQECEAGAGERDEWCCTASTGGKAAHAVSQSAAVSARGGRLTDPGDRQALERCLLSELRSAVEERGDGLPNVRNCRAALTCGSRSCLSMCADCRGDQAIALNAGYERLVWRVTKSGLACKSQSSPTALEFAHPTPCELDKHRAISVVAVGSLARPGLGSDADS